MTVADALAVPPDPVQARANVLELVNAPLGWLPEIVLLPDHAPEAAQEVALVDDQVRVEVPPLVTDVGLAASDTVGTGGGVPVTVIDTDALAVPADPVQARVNVLELVNAPLEWLPEIALLPDHAPDATQEVALVDDQVRVEAPPLVIDVGLGASDTVGSGGACVVTTNVPATPPIVNVAVVVVLNAPAEVWRAVTVCPGLIVPAVVTNVPPLML